MGMRGIIRKERVNRGGLGSILLVSPLGLGSVMTRIVGGEGFGSQSSSRKNFGLGPERSGPVGIVWPKGIRNRFYGLRNKEMLTAPEIPCSFSGKWKSEHEYIAIA